jgi:hypothetical protein
VGPVKRDGGQPGSGIGGGAQLEWAIGLQEIAPGPRVGVRVAGAEQVASHGGGAGCPQQARSDEELAPVERHRADSRNGTGAGAATAPGG